MNRALQGLFCLMVCCGTVSAETPDRVGVPNENLLVNGDFEKGTEGWNAIWSHEAGSAQAVLDRTKRHGGAQSLRIEHTGRKDWSFGHSLNLNVHPGEIYELTAWVHVQGAGNATLGVVTRDAAGKATNWVYGGRSTHETKTWLFLRSRIIVPPGTATIWPRLIGYGPATVWCDDFVLARRGSLDALRVKDFRPR